MSVSFPLTIAVPRNMTWHGKQGFQTPIEPETFIVENMGVFGNQHIERGLACESIFLRPA